VCADDGGDTETLSSRRVPTARSPSTDLTSEVLLVMDPLGNVPVFLSVLKTVRPERQRRVWRAIGGKAESATWPRGPV
jgi:hypothetical protein